MSKGILLPALFLPNISYFHVIKHHEEPILIEQFENFPKQTFRTRAKIATANGTLDLIVPTVHGKRMHVPMKDIRINYDHPWQRLHWLSLQTAYRSSPYFEYYEDDFAPFFEKKFEFLLDFNVQQLEMMLKMLKLKRDITFTDSYQDAEGEVDYRNVFRPKSNPLQNPAKPYYQLFEENNGFRPNLSAVDLLFNQGPQAKSYL